MCERVILLLYYYYYIRGVWDPRKRWRRYTDVHCRIHPATRAAVPGRATWRRAVLAGRDHVRPGIGSRTALLPASVLSACRAATGAARRRVGQGQPRHLSRCFVADLRVSGRSRDICRTLASWAALPLHACSRFTHGTFTVWAPKRRPCTYYEINCRNIGIAFKSG
jgi:hypothetical protein